MNAQIYRAVLSRDDIGAILGNAVLRKHDGPLTGSAHTDCIFCFDHTTSPATLAQVRVEVTVDGGGA